MQYWLKDDCINSFTKGSFKTYAFHQGEGGLPKRWQNVGIKQVTFPSTINIKKFTEIHQEINT